MPSTLAASSGDKGAHLRIGDVFRYSKSADPDQPELDGFANYMHATRGQHGKKLILERGISAPSRVKAKDGPRIGAVLIRSTSRTAGTETNPWHDYIDPNSGLVLYYGDAKPSTRKPANEVSGNALLLEVRKLHAGSPQDRLAAPPLLFFESEAAGFVTFQGYGVIERAELVTQLDPINGTPFTNYRFECAILSLTNEHEVFDWEWINARRDPSLSLAEVLGRAPAAWKRWVTLGDSVLEQVRRRVLHAPVKKPREQAPQTASQEELLQAIYLHYEKNKHAFESLAETVVTQVMREAGLKYVRGWVTRKSSDGGVDFVGRIDLGSGFGAVKVVVLGQAKCESPNKPTSGKDLARTVARLRRGWLGVYVTTGLFSTKAQEEIIEDEWPLMLINGAMVASTVRRLMIEQGVSDVAEFLQSLEDVYSTAILKRRPDEILFDLGVDLETIGLPEGDADGQSKQEPSSLQEPG